MANRHVHVRHFQYCRQYDPNHNASTPGPVDTSSGQYIHLSYSVIVRPKLGGLTELGGTVWASV